MSQAQRILIIIQMLLNKQTINSKKLSHYFNTNQRSIQRDIQLIKEFFKDKLYQPKRGEYILQDNASLYSFIQNKQNNGNLKDFFEFITLFDDKLLKFFNQKQFPIIKQIQKETSITYHILQKPIESLKTPFLSQIKQAIYQRRYANLSYKEIKLRDFESIKPIKIVFAEGNWYLASITNNYKLNHGFKFFRINFITNFQLLQKTFHRNIEATNFIKNFQSLFQDYKTPFYEVKLQADAKIARHFQVKKYLKSQKILEKKENGNLIITYTINNDMEIIPLIKKWLPYLKVLSPKTIDAKIKRDIKLYINN